MLCVCVVDVMDVVLYVCIVRRGAVGARVWEVWVFRHTYIVCLCLVCILWQFSMLRSAWLSVCRGCNRWPYGRGILQSWSHNCLVGSHECLLLFTPSCCSEYSKRHSLHAVKLSLRSDNPVQIVSTPPAPNNGGPILSCILLDRIEYYNENNADGYLLLLDASKAFDIVHHAKLIDMVKIENM